MTTQSLSITYNGPEASGGLGLLQIEQQPWAPYTGKVTRAEMVRYLSALLYGGEYQSSIDCGLVAGAVVCVVNVYPRVADLVYQFQTSHGTLSGRSVEMVKETEAMSFALTTEVTPSHPVRAILAVEWISECYNADGAVVDQAQLSTDGSTITIPTPVYGSVSVTYRTERHSYVLNAPRRDDAIDNFYSAAVFGVYDGGVDWLTIEMPPGIETFEADAGAYCGWGSTASVTDDDPDYPVTDGKHTRTTDVDYCSQETISEEIL